MLPTQPHLVHYIPIATTVLSAAFFVVLMKRWRMRGGNHHLWWAAGIFAYGLGTGLESAVTLVGNSAGLNKAWYIAGAILGGYPLAQGSVYFHFSRRTAHILTALTLPFIVGVSLLVALSPTNLELLQPHRPGGAALGWQWIRLLTPIINTYAVIFLIGSAIYSAINFAGSHESGSRCLGNALIAVGAILPGIGGAMAKAGMVELLYIAEFLGLILIWLGFTACVSGIKNGKVRNLSAGSEHAPFSI